MFFPHRGEIVPRVSKPLGHGAWPSPQNAGQEAGSIRYHSGNWTGLASDPQGERPSGGVGALESRGRDAQGRGENPILGEKRFSIWTGPGRGG